MTFEDVVLAFENSDFCSGVKVPGTQLDAIFKWKNLASKSEHQKIKLFLLIYSILILSIERKLLLTCNLSFYDKTPFKYQNY